MDDLNFHPHDAIAKPSELEIAALVRALAALPANFANRGSVAFFLAPSVMGRPRGIDSSNVHSAYRQHARF